MKESGNINRINEFDIAEICKTIFTCDQETFEALMEVIYAEAPFLCEEDMIILEKAITFKKAHLSTILEKYYNREASDAILAEETKNGDKILNDWPETSYRAMNGKDRPSYIIE